MNKYHGGKIHREFNIILILLSWSSESKNKLIFIEALVYFERRDRATSSRENLLHNNC